MVKKVAVINDISGLGKCSLTASIPVLSVMGVQACPIPTAVLSNQTDYDSYYYIDCTSHMDAYIAEWKKMGLSVDGIYSGFLGHEQQVEKVLNFIKDFRKEDTLLLVDPVMGDNGHPYDVYTAELGNKMRNLVNCADVITPNVTELCILTDTDYDALQAKQTSENYLEEIVSIAKKLLSENCKTVIVTGILYQSATDSEERFYNLVLTPDGYDYVSATIQGGSFSGTGDIMASIVCAGMMNGKSALKCVELASHFLETAMEDTIKDHVNRNDGINFEPYLRMLLEESI